MRILLIHANRERAPQPVAPMGLCLVASAIEEHGFEVRLLDLCFSRRPEAELARTLQDWPPDAIGLSLRNLDNGESLRPRSHLPAAEALARVCRRYSSAPLIIGGAAVNVAPQEVLRRVGADYALVGEGEEALPLLLERLHAKEPVEDVPGVYRDSTAAPPAPARVADLGVLCTLQSGVWLDLRRYFRGGAVLPVQTKRGCAFPCTYCTYPLLEGTAYRLRPPIAVRAEVEELVYRRGVRHLEFVDSTFNHPYAHAYAVCEELTRASPRAELHTMGLNPSGLDADLLRVMCAAGFRSAVCGAESGSERMLASLQKGFTVDDVARAAAALRASGLSTLWSFMFGGPGEDETTVRETLHFIETALGPRDRVICTLGLRVYPSTRLAEIAREEGLITAETDLSEPVFYQSPHISVARTMELIEASPARSRLVYLETIQRPSVAWLYGLWTRLGAPVPAWDMTPLYNRLTRALGSGRPKSR